VLFRLVFSQLERTEIQAVQDATQKSSSSLTNRSDQADDFAMKKNIWSAAIEVGFIIFLFYSNLLMGEFERSGMRLKRGVVWAIEDVFTIAATAGLIGYVVFEFLRKRF
jgi:hypothetical protein